MSGDLIQLPGVDPADQPPVFTDRSWNLPAGAVPVDCIAFGKVIRDVERLTKRLAAAEMELRAAKQKIDSLTAEADR